MIKTILLSLIIFYLFVVLVVYLYQGHLLYQPSKDSPLPAEWDVPNMEIISLQTKDGLKLTAWYQVAAQANLPTILYFHGNGGHLGERGPVIKSFLDQGYGVLLLSYRGYDGNPGKPSEQGLYYDGHAAVDYLYHVGVDPSCIVLYGESLGSGVAVQMAQDRKVGAIVLQAPYTSMPDVAALHYPWLPARLILKDQYNSLDKIKEIKIPVLVVHGEKDIVIPIEFGKKLFSAANEPKQAAYFPEVDHINFPDLYPVVAKFLDQHLQCTSVPNQLTSDME